MNEFVLVWPVSPDLHPDPPAVTGTDDPVTMITGAVTAFAAQRRSRRDPYGRDGSFRTWKPMQLPVMAVSVQDHAATVLVHDLADAHGIDETLAVLDGFRVGRVMNQHHPQLVVPGLQQFGQVPALAGADFPGGEKGSGRGGGIHPDEGDRASLSDPGKVVSAIIGLIVGPPQRHRIFVCGGHIAVVIAWNEGDVLGSAKHFEPMTDLAEFVWQADLGQVPGQHDVVDRLRRQIPGQGRQHVGTMLMAAFQLPREVAQEAFVGQIPEMGMGLSQMEIREMGETESRFHELRPWMQAAILTPVPEAVTFLADKVRERHGSSAVEAIVMYGSCLRSGNPYDGLVDLYVLVKDYTSAYDHRWLVLLNSLLPPNVFYYETTYQGKVIRCKYAVVSCDHFAAGMQRWFHSYLWGRFAQPCRLVYFQGQENVGGVADLLLLAAARLVAETVPLLPDCFDWQTLWRTGLRYSYSAELRTERAGQRARELVDYAADHFRHLTPAIVASLPYSFQADANEQFCVQIPRRVRIRVRVAWSLRKIQGKGLSLLRLIKSLFTFQGGVDYILWKLERHSGQRIEISPRVRRHPLIYGWGVLWKLYRQGAFR